MEVHYRRFEAVAVNTLATVYARRGEHTEAVTHHREALAMVRDLEDRHLEAQILLDIAETCLAAGDHGAAAAAMASAEPLLGVALLVRQATAVRAALDAAGNPGVTSNGVPTRSSPP
jgi:ATP/maltotriose-dependent transcriptional regulator MalT